PARPPPTLYPLAGSAPSAEMGPAHRPLVVPRDSSRPPARSVRTHGPHIGGRVMAIVSRALPERPHLDVPRRQARELLALWRSSNADALERIRRRHPKLSTPAVLAAAVPRLSDAQLVIAREYGFSHWT